MMRGEEKICIERQKKSDKQPENVHIDKKKVVKAKEGGREIGG